HRRLARRASPTELARRLDVLAAEIERLKLGEAAVEADTSEHGMGPAASKVYRKSSGLSVGGYGELLYQSLASTATTGPVGPARPDRLPARGALLRLQIRRSLGVQLRDRGRARLDRRGRRGLGRIRLPRLSLAPELERAFRARARTDGLCQRATRADGVSRCQAARCRAGDLADDLA
ncbi:MAG: hypothetical protein HC897_14895, partial [Thermoanaerobaculia bacterium]|nr:hypothetical protein [Thermoanaerobaculia bacterium]